MRRHIYKFIPCGFFGQLIINLLKWIGKCQVTLAETEIYLIFYADYSVAWQYGILLTYPGEQEDDKAVKALLLVVHNQPFKPTTGNSTTSTNTNDTTPSTSAATTPTASSAPPQLLPTLSSSSLNSSCSSISDEKERSENVDFFEVRVCGGENEMAAARVFRGINESIEMLAQKRYPN